ncbi:MAG: helix-turn-helix transcriptional regulator [Rhizobiaceae bacterium]|nr:helix-turn-helix transcriptional regulator [Rhizobiaceae bacterium]
MIEHDQRRLLGEFVRAHRERLPPPEPGGRRRTPGLRREELAARAGISATWCTWIEQGREVRASPETLKRLAVALALSPAERSYMFELAGRIDPDAGDADGPDALVSLRTAVGLLDCPAYGLDPFWNACCWNTPAGALFRGWLDGGSDRAGKRNLLRFVFLDHAAPTLIPEWEERARRLLAEFRADFAHNFRDMRMRALVDDLLAGSPLFAKAWHAQDVQHREGGLRSFRDRDGGVLRFIQHTFHPAGHAGYKLVILLPAPVEDRPEPR